MASRSVTGPLPAPILGLVFRGLRLGEAAVEAHPIHVSNKLGVADRTAAVAVALERGLIRLGA